MRLSQLVCKTTIERSSSERAAIGKGTVQNILPLQYGRSALRLTVARYYRPNGENIHRVKDATRKINGVCGPTKDWRSNLMKRPSKNWPRRWREASYPSLALVDDVAVDCRDDDVGKADDAPASGTASDAVGFRRREPGGCCRSRYGRKIVTSGLLIDAQLRRAVEYLREAVRGQRPGESRFD